MSCPHRPPCPGCPRYGEPGPAPAGVARLAELAEALGAPAPRIESGLAQGSRHRARLAVRGRTRSPKIGLFQEGSHRIVDIPRCELHHPALNLLAAEVKAAIREVGARPYSDTAHAGDVRYVQGVVQRSDDRLQVVIVANEIEPVATAPLLDRLGERLGDRLQGLFFNGQPERSNSIIGPHWKHWLGDATTSERIGGAQVFFPPGAFGQANLDLFKRLVRRVHEWVPDGARVLECYAGCGAIGLGLADRVERIQMNERSPHGLAGMALGIAALPESVRNGIEIIEGSAEITRAELEKTNGPEVVIVDPPRRGLDRALCEGLAEHPPDRLVYVSCGLDSFVEDAERLVRDGGLALKAVEAWSFFPFTEHVEVLARFDRVGSEATGRLGAAS